MKVAVTYADGTVFQHFGHCENFKMYEIEDGKVTSSALLSTAGTGGHGALAEFLKQNGIDTLICGGIGGGARSALEEAGVRFYPGVVGNADDCVTALLAGSLDYNPDTMCKHHGEGHVCGDHH